MTILTDSDYGFVRLHVCGLVLISSCLYRECSFVFNPCTFTFDSCIFKGDTRKTAAGLTVQKTIPGIVIRRIHAEKACLAKSTATSPRRVMKYSGKAYPRVRGLASLRLGPRAKLVYLEGISNWASIPSINLDWRSLVLEHKARVVWGREGGKGGDTHTCVCLTGTACMCRFVCVWPHIQNHGTAGIRPWGFSNGGNWQKGSF
jgi:hypothetical protein